jgi:ribosomal-protein-alanine N-acetyltransferase
LIDDVTLRRVDPDSDAADIAAYHSRNREFLAPFEPIRGPEYYDVDGTRERLRTAAELHGDRMVYWTIRIGDDVIGSITLNNIARGMFQNADLGYGIDEVYNGKGIATRAVALAVESAFGERGLHRVQAATLVGNIASQRVLEKNGFQPIGLSPRYLKIAGTWQDHLLFAITND